MGQGGNCATGSAYQGSIKFLLGWALVCGMSIIDLVLTLRLYSHAVLDEMNPIACGLFDLHPAYVVLLKFVSMLVFTVVLWILHIKSYNIAVKVLIFANAVLIFTMIQHIRILLI